MKQLTKKPYLIFLFSTPLIMLVGIIYKDFHLNLDYFDTYYFISLLDFAKLVSVSFGFLGLGYWFIRKANQELSNWLKWIHIVLTFSGVLILPILSQVRRHDIIEYQFNSNLNSIMLTLTVILFLSQTLLPINLTYVLVRNNIKLD